MQEHIEFLSSTFQTAYYATDSYLNDTENNSVFTKCIEDGTDGSEVHYSLSKYNVDSPIRLNLILADRDRNIVYTSYGADDMNLHRIAFNGIVCDNAAENGPDLYHTVYYFTGDTSEYVFSKPLYRGGELIGFVGAYLNGHDWARLLSDYQYDNIITTANGDIIFCSREGFLPERNTNKFRNESQERMVFLHGNRYLLSSHFMKDEGVFLYSFIYYPKNVLYLTIGILTIVFLGVIWFIMTLRLSKLMAEKNARSVGMLADEMRIIRHGDSGHVIEIHTGDEFEEIASQINRMVKSINDLNTRNTDLIRLNSMIEISNLQTQINPHFIYNTLDTIKYLIMSEPDKAAHLIEKFTHILRYSHTAGVGVAVKAAMAAGVVGADVCRQAAGTLPAGRLLRGQPQGAVQRGLKGLLRHAAAAIGTIAGKRGALGTGAYCHAVFFADLNKSLSQRFALRVRDAFYLRKIPPNLLVKVDKADYTGLCIAGKHSCHLLKFGDMSRSGVGIAKENGVIPPCDTVRADNF